MGIRETTPTVYINLNPLLHLGPLCVYLDVCRLGAFQPIVLTVGMCSTGHYRSWHVSACAIPGISWAFFFIFPPAGLSFSWVIITNVSGMDKWKFIWAGLIWNCAMNNFPRLWTKIFITLSFPTWHRISPRFPSFSWTVPVQYLFLTLVNSFSPNHIPLFVCLSIQGCQQQIHFLKIFFQAEGASNIFLPSRLVF